MATAFQGGAGGHGPPNSCLAAKLVESNAARAEDMKGNGGSAAQRREMLRLRPPTAIIQEGRHMFWLYRPAQSTNECAVGKGKRRPALRSCGALTAYGVSKKCHGRCILSSLPGQQRKVHQNICGVAACSYRAFKKLREWTASQRVIRCGAFKHARWSYASPAAESSGSPDGSDTKA